mmetsp:Transcript_16206/g.41703  ORF Transcript_16206/g.41703 Transcript_16206/m.41703 type:complete len:274 (-) Transcript_16206:1449-2270(-)
MRHHRQVAPVLGAQRRNPLRRPVRVPRVRLRGRAVLADVRQRRQRGPAHAVQHRGVRERGTPLAVRGPDAEGGAGHAREHDRRRVADGERGKAAFEAARGVMDEARLLRGIEGALAEGDEAEESHELAAVADAERESVVAAHEGIELRGDFVAEADHTGPPLGRVHHVGIGKSTDESDTSELVQSDRTARNISHAHVPRVEASEMERRSHLAVAVGTFLTNDCHLVFLCSVHQGAIGMSRSKREVVRRALHSVDALLFRDNTAFRRLLSLEVE